MCFHIGPRSSPFSRSLLPLSIAASASGSVFISCVDGSLDRISSAGVLSIQFPTPSFSSAGTCSQLAADSKDNTYCLNFNKLKKIAPDGTTTPLATVQQPSDQVLSIALSNDTLYLAIRRTGETRLYTLAGAGGASTDRAPMVLSNPFSMAIGNRGEPYLVMLGRITRWGTPAEPLFSSIGLQFYPGGFSGDGGPAESAAYNAPDMLTADSKGNMYFIDNGSQRIRRISASPRPPLPVISQNGIVNSASYAAGSLTGGELFSIFGQNLAQGAAVFSLRDVFVDNALISTKAYLDGGAIPLISVSPTQVNAIMPQGYNSPTARLHIEVDGVASQEVAVPVAPAAFGLFTANASGSGNGSIVNQDGTINSPANPALRGAYASLYGTGAGNFTPYLWDGFLSLSSTLSKFDNTATVKIAGAGVPVIYAGTAPSLVTGVAQLNIGLPSTLPAGANDLIVTVAGQPSNKVTIWLR